jgi:hypothetical protein
MDNFRQAAAIDRGNLKSSQTEFRLKGVKNIRVILD